MSENNTPYKMKGSPMQRNFGIGPGLSPYKAEGDEETTGKPKVETKEYGDGESEKGDKGWVKALKAGVTIASKSLASVYGGTAHNPRINWGKKKKEEDAKTPGSELADDIINKDNTAADYSNSSKSDMSAERDRLKAAGTFDPEGGDPASVAIQNKINELYNSSKRY